MENVQRAEALFASGFNCAQSVLAAYAPQLGLLEEVALKLCSPFGSGARNGELCGAVSGALMALGLQYGYDTMNEEEKQRVCALAVEFTTRFREENGSIRCEELLGYDVKKPEEMKVVREKQLFETFCPKLVKSAAEILEQLLKAQECALWPEHLYL